MITRPAMGIARKIASGRSAPAGTKYAVSTDVSWGPIHANQKSSSLPMPFCGASCMVNVLCAHSSIM